MTGRRDACSRWYSMNPVFLPMMHLLFYCDRNRQWSTRNILLLRTADSQYTLELVRENFDEARQHFEPAVENALGAATARQFMMAADQLVQEFNIFWLDDRFEINHRKIAALLGELAFFVEHVGDASAHSSGEVAPARAENDHQTIRHVFAAVVADTLDHCGCTRVTDGEAFAGDSTEVGFSAGGSVEDYIANNDILLSYECGLLRREHNHASA